MAANDGLKDEIATYVENLVFNEGLDYIDACLDALDQFHMDYIEFSRHLSPALKMKMEREALERGILKRTSHPMVLFE